MTVSRQRRGWRYEVAVSHTLPANEQHMSRVAADILKQEDIPAGNIPVAVWLYNIPEEPLPKV